MSDKKLYHVTIDFPAFECEVRADDVPDAIRYADDELYSSGYIGYMLAATFTVREVSEAAS